VQRKGCDKEKEEAFREEEVEMGKVESRAPTENISKHRGF